MPCARSSWRAPRRRASHQSRLPRAAWMNARRNSTEPGHDGGTVGATSRPMARRRTSPARSAPHPCHAAAVWDPARGSAAAAPASIAACRQAVGSSRSLDGAPTPSRRTTSSPSNSRRPVSISNSTTPKAQMSARLSTGASARLLGRHVGRGAENHAQLAWRERSASANSARRLR